MCRHIRIQYAYTSRAHAYACNAHLPTLGSHTYIQTQRHTHTRTHTHTHTHARKRNNFRRLFISEACCLVLLQVFRVCEHFGNTSSFRLRTTLLEGVSHGKAEQGGHRTSPCRCPLSPTVPYPDKLNTSNTSSPPRVYWKVRLRICSKVYHLKV